MDTTRLALRLGWYAIRASSAYVFFRGKRRGEFPGSENNHVADATKLCSRSEPLGIGYIRWH